MGRGLEGRYLRYRYIGIGIGRYLYHTRRYAYSYKVSTVPQGTLV